MIKGATRNLIIKILVVVFAVTCLLCLGNIVNNKPTTVYCDVETSVQIKDAYMLGETFDLPAGEIIQGDDRHQAQETILISPNGVASQAQKVTLSQKGEYKLVYHATVGNEKLTAEKKFSVLDAYYSLSGDGEENSNFKLVDEFNMAPEQDISGVSVSLAKNTELKVNEVFDASVLTKDTPVATIYPYNNTFLMNKSHGYIQAYDIQIVLTDYYDSTNYLIFEYHWLDNFADYAGQPLATQETAPDMHYMISTKGSAFPTYYGVGANMRRSDVWVNEDGLELDHPVSKYGNDTNPLYTGNKLPEGATYDHSYGFSFYFDYETFGVYGDSMNQTSKVIGKALVGNVGSTEKYGEKAFTGFTNGKFTVSFKADDYKPITGLADSELVCNIEISNILGKTGEELKPESMPKDDNAPYIIIENAENKVVVAKGEEVKLPAVEVKDIDLKSVIAQVYYGYGTSHQSLVVVKDGKFTPSRVGNYTVLFTAEDEFGNVSTKTIDIEAKVFPNNQSLSLDVDKVENVPAGKLLTLPEHAVVGESLDKFSKVYYAYDGGEFIEITDTLSFLVEHVGNYTIRYEYYNLLSTYEYEYEFTSVASDAVVFVQATMPKRFIKNSSYTLENYSAFKYVETNPIECEPKIFASEDGGEYLEIDAKKYTVNAQESVQFKYVLDGAEEYSDVIPVLDLMDELGQYRLGEHFITDDFSYVSELDKITFIPKNTHSNYMEFANPVSFSNFYLELLPPQGFVNYESIVITLTDYYDSDNVVTIGYKKQIVNADLPNEYAAMNFTVNGQMQIDYQTHYEGSTIQFYCRNGRIYAGKFIFNIGDVISNDKVMVGISVNNVTDLDKAKLEIKTLNNLTVGIDRYDENAPQLYFKKTAAEYQDLGSEVTIYPAVATDLLSGFVLGNLKMWVDAPKKADVFALDGTPLKDKENVDPTKQYTFKLEKEGRYKVNYEYTDTNGNKYSVGYNVYTGDSVPPEIILNGGYNENTVVKVKLGTEYKVQDYTVSDVGTPIEELYVSVLVKVPAGYMIKITDTIKFEQKGTYTIYYHCMDGSTNTAMTYYTVVVK